MIFCNRENDRDQNHRGEALNHGNEPPIREQKQNLTLEEMYLTHAMFQLMLFEYSCSCMSPMSLAGEIEMSLKDDLALLIRQEGVLQFEHFDEETAWQVGAHIYGRSITFSDVVVSVVDLGSNPVHQRRVDRHVLYPRLSLRNHCYRAIGSGDYLLGLDELKKGLSSCRTTSRAKGTTA